MDNPALIKLANTIYRMFNIFPVKKNRVMFSSFYGKRYGDNPRYISELLHERNPELEIIWEKAKGEEPDFPDYVKSVRVNTPAQFLALATSRVWVDSHLKPFWMSKRKNQFFIDTWHGGLGFKKLYSDISGKDSRQDIKNYAHSSNLANAFIANSDFEASLYTGPLQYNGRILKYGNARNDVFFKDNSETVTRVRKFFKADDEMLVLYVPTFRDEFNPADYALDLAGLRTAVRERFGKECKILVRLHPLTGVPADTLFKFDGEDIDATDYPSVQDLVMAADLLITDYSSTVFDFALLKRPAFLFVPDLKKYTAERGLYEESIEAYPFPSAEDNAGLCEKIAAYDESEYLRNLNAYMKKCGLSESGEATLKTVKLIEKVIAK